MKKIIITLCVIGSLGFGTVMAQKAKKPRTRNDRMADFMKNLGGGDFMNNFRGNTKNDTNAVEELKKEDPERYKQLLKLKKESPQEYRKQVRELSQELKVRKKAETNEFNALVKAYFENPSDELREQVREKIAEKFEKKLSVAEVKLDAEKKEYEKAEKALNKRKEQKESIIDTKLEETLRDPDLNW